MNEYLAETVRQRMERTADALKKNRMDAYLVKSRSEVVPLIRTLLHPNDTVAVGGSVSLDECGVLDLLRCGDYQFLDRYASGLSGEQIAEIYRKSFFADAFLCSTNAVTESGELYNVDGNGNRVAAMTFGPASVILVVGANKIVRDLAEAEQRVKEFAAPANCNRLACKTPCAVTGKCADCSGDGRICCTAVVHRQQRIPGRIKVILVEESLGY